MYEYFRRLIKKSFPHEISKLRSIAFSHAAYLIPNDLQASILTQIKSFAEKFENNDSNFSFPVRVNVHGHGLEIQEADKNYVIQLNKFYNSFMCYYESYLKKIPNFDFNLLRFLYFITGPRKRLPKSIHYTKNVYSLFTHDAIHYAKDSIILEAPWIDTHVNSHFRADLSVFFGNEENSIRGLNFDYEYLFFLLQRYTDYCV